MSYTYVISHNGFCLLSLFFKFFHTFYGYKDTNDINEYMQ